MELIERKKYKTEMQNYFLIEVIRLENCLSGSFTVRTHEVCKGQELTKVVTKVCCGFSKIP